MKKIFTKGMGSTWHNPSATFGMMFYIPGDASVSVDVDYNQNSDASIDVTGITVSNRSEVKLFIGTVLFNATYTPRIREHPLRTCRLLPDDAHVLREDYNFIASHCDIIVEYGLIYAWDGFPQDAIWRPE